MDTAAFMNFVRFHCDLNEYCTVFQQGLKLLEIIGILLTYRKSKTSKGLKSYKEFKF